MSGPGIKIVLLHSSKKALFIWRKFRDDSGQVGWNCAVFRNETNIQSSQLIIEAEKKLKQLYKPKRLYTYVNPKKIKSSNPGFCFQVAGWNKCGITKVRKLIILEKYCN